MMPGPKMNFVCGPVAEYFYATEKKPLSEIAKIMQCAISSVRQELINRGVKMRTLSEAMALIPEKLSARAKGKKRPPFSVEWKNKIRTSRKLWAEKNAIGFSKKPNGYIEHTRGPYKGRSVHVVLMEQKIGRPLLPNEVVHHKDHNRSNNEINNLELMTRGEHSREHAIENAPKRKRTKNGRFT